MDLEVIGTLPMGEIDYESLARALHANKGQPAIINVNVGTTVKGAVDDLDRILRTLAAVGGILLFCFSSMATAADEDMNDEGWLPLESNPALLNGFMKKMGLPKGWSWNDVYGTDDEMLAWVPKPVVAFVLLFPCTESIAAFKKEQAETILKTGQKLSKDLFYVTQLDGFGNACGTIATIHALANNTANFKLTDSPLTAFIASAKDMTPDKRGEALLRAKGIREVSEDTASSKEASTECPTADTRVDAHFIAFVLIDGDIYELDGRKQFPINHGPAKMDTFLKKTVSVVKTNFMAKTESLNFSMMALSKTSD